MRKLLLISLILCSCQGGGTAQFTDLTVKTPLEKVPLEHYSCCWETLIQSAKKENLDYAQNALAAMNGSGESRKKLLLFSEKTDIRYAYGHGSVLVDILSQIGDAAFAQDIEALKKSGVFKKEHPFFQEPFGDSLRNIIEGGFSFHKSPQKLSDYPLTSDALKYKVTSESQTH